MSLFTHPPPAATEEWEGEVVPMRYGLLILGIAVCISASFITPIAHESTLLVMGPGRYSFRDYMVLGAPFALLTWLVTVFAVPWIWPLTG